MHKFNTTEKVFSLLCFNKNRKWGDQKKANLSEKDLINLKKREWKDFWARMKVAEPSLKDRILMDYGCGDGFESLIMLQKGAKFVYCLEISTERLKNAKKLHESYGFKNVSYIDNNDVNQLVAKIGYDTVDIIISRDVMEHVPFPFDVLKSMFEVLKPKGVAYIGFSPLYKSPYGPHIGNYCKVPYVHHFFSEKTIINVLKELYGLPSNIHNFLDIPGSGVNKLSYYAYLKLISKFNWQIEKSNINCFPKRIWLSTALNFIVKIIPIKSLKEFFIVSSYSKIIKQ